MTKVTWWEAEMHGAKLPDQRFRRSLQRLPQRLARHPGQAWSRALGPAYRQSFRRLSKRMNDDRSYTNLLLGHYQQTAQRCLGYDTVIVAQDTTYVNFDGHQNKDLGPISDDPQGNGLLAHSALAVTTSGVPLGCLELRLWARDRQAHGQKHDRQQRPPEAKESARWRQTVEAVQERVPDGPDGPELFVCGDSEADNFYLLSVPRRPGCHLLCRMAQARKVRVPLGSAAEAEGVADTAATRSLLEVARAAPMVGRQTVWVSAQRDARGRLRQPAREAQVEVSLQAVWVQPPKHWPADQPAEPVQVWIVRSYEPSPPPGVKPLEWILACTKPVEDAATALRMVAYYALRWKVERLHYVLKSGLNVERLQVWGRGEVFCAIALLWIAAWRILWLTHVVRAAPDTPAAEMLSPDELVVLQRATQRQVRTAAELARAIAQLGGAEHWRNAPPPGEKRLWMGLNTLASMMILWRNMPGGNAIQE